MPYKKNYKKRTTRRPAKKSAVRTIARQEAKKVVAKQVESKMYDGYIATTSIDFSGTTCVFSATHNSGAGTLITQGVNDSQYIGGIINPTHLTIRGNFTCASNENNMVRVVVIQQAALGGLPSLATLLESVGNIRAPLSPYDRTYDNTYRVLADRLFTVNPVTRPIQPFKIKISKNKLRRITFSDGSGTVERGLIAIMFISDSAISTHPTVDMFWRLFYKDS